MTISKNKVKYIHSLKEKKNRDEVGTFVAEGDKMVMELLVLMKCQLLIATTDFIQSINIEDFNIEELIEVPKKELEKMSFQKSPQQALAVFYQPQYAIDNTALSNQLCLALDGIQDPGNMGTIVRLADWYGIENIFCSKDTVDIYNVKVVQATMGALARVRVHYVNLPKMLSELKNISVFGTFLDGKDMYEQELSQTGIIVMGNEGNGIRPEIAKFITNRLFIPNYPSERNTSESLNVAVATAIICSEFRRRILY